MTTAGGTDTLTGAYEFVAAPTTTDITPQFGPIAGGTPVTITGTGFEAGTTVTFGGTPATNIAVDPGGTFVTMSSAGPRGRCRRRRGDVDGWAVEPAAAVHLPRRRRPPPH